ncbi:MAG: hypothetical protein WA240_06950 [Nitrospirota bacterium]
MAEHISNGLRLCNVSNLTRCTLQSASYTLKEIADYLVIHYTTVSKIVKEVDGRN